MKTYRIAGLTVHMDTWGRTLAQAKPYLVEDAARADITIPSFDMSGFQNATKEALEIGEYNATAQVFYYHLLKYHGMMVHASAVVMDGKAYLFSAESGTGKSTHTSLWQQVFGEDRVKILNDDKPALRCEDGVWYAYGTPWSGKHDISVNIRVPLAGICMLERGEKNSIVPLEGPRAAYMILNQTPRHQHPALRQLLIENLADLLEKIPVYTLKCNMEPEAAQLSHGVMSGEMTL